MVSDGIEGELEVEEGSCFGGTFTYATRGVI